MYLKVALRILELESTDNLSSPYSINLSITAFERFGKSCGCNKGTLDDTNFRKLEIFSGSPVIEFLMIYYES